MATATARRAEHPPDLDESRLRTRVVGILNRHPAVGLALGVIRGGRLESFHGHGLADLESGAPIADDTAFRIGSVTKLFTAVAVMQLWERGLVDLDAPASEYLRSYRAPSREPPVPPRHDPPPADPHFRDPGRSPSVRPSPFRLGPVRGAASAAQRSVR